MFGNKKLIVNKMINKWDNFRSWERYEENKVIW